MYNMDTKSKEDADENEHSHWITAICASKKSKNTKYMVLL